MTKIKSYAVKEKLLLFLSTQQVQSTYEESRTVYSLLQVTVDRFLIYLQVLNRKNILVWRIIWIKIQVFMQV